MVVPAAAPRRLVLLPVDLATAGTAVQTPVFQRCVRLDGDDAADVAGLASTIPGDVAVEQDGARYVFSVRPIYPDEAGVDCP